MEPSIIGFLTDEIFIIGLFWAIVIAVITRLAPALLSRLDDLGSWEEMEMETRQPALKSYDITPDLTDHGIVLVVENDNPEKLSARMTRPLPSGTGRLIITNPATTGFMK
jgi:hypothetical protein